MNAIQELGSLLTSLIAIMMAYIAYQQWRTNKDKLKMDLYDRRYNISIGTVPLLHRNVMSRGRY